VIPFWAMVFARSRRLARFEEQFPEAIDLIARFLRAGHAFATGIKMAADERIPFLDARFFVTAMLTQREAVGNLPEVLERLVAVIRERFQIEREVRVRSAPGRMAATYAECRRRSPSSHSAIRRMPLDDPLGVRSRSSVWFAASRSPA
jgi:tight adherence protein B